MNARLELSSRLPRPLPVEALVVCFSKDRLLLARYERGADLPRVRFETAEPLEKTIRREVFSQTGAFLSRSEQVGLLHTESGAILPIYVGLIHHFERPVLSTAGNELVPLDDLDKRLAASAVCDVLHELLEHAFALHQSLSTQ